ncbi:hypothetical protein TIFTF001_041460 [Ficus carica]|uniref:Uncharacterized protein n=1 Tax=Ficus carica TaxID=3494 RepID=A0AA87ZWS8_FICCA|nr:hypothetical protein TIFTF001_041460 [Ficus carica]
MLTRSIGSRTYWIASSPPELDREGKEKSIAMERGLHASPSLRTGEAVDFVGIAKTTMFSREGTGVVENRARRSRQRRMELGGKIGVGGGGSGVIGRGREKLAEGTKRERRTRHQLLQNQPEQLVIRKPQNPQIRQRPKRGKLTTDLIVPQIQNFQVAKQLNGISFEELTTQTVMTQVQMTNGVHQAPDVLHRNRNRAVELVSAQIDTLDIAQLGQDIGNVAPELIGVQIEDLHLLKIGEPVGKSALESVLGEIEILQIPEITDPLRDRAVELVPRQNQMLKRGHPFLRPHVAPRQGYDGDDGLPVVGLATAGLRRR